MAKEVATKKETKLELAKVADLDQMMDEFAGVGLSTRREDNIAPQLTLLQRMSPQVMDGAERIEGAEPGDFLLGERIIKGRVGLWVQPCAEEHKMFEFTPLDRGGGFVAQHAMARDESGNVVFDDAGDPLLPPGAKKVGNFKYELAASGNSLIHYRHWHVIVWEGATGEALTIPFKSTGHTTARKWMWKANTSNRLPDGRSRALFGQIYHVTSSPARNAKGQYFIHAVGPAVCLDPRVSPEVSQVISDPIGAFKRGALLARASASGEIRSPLPERIEDGDPSQDQGAISF